MKVLLISSGSGSRGGGEIYLRLLAQGLAALGHEMHALIGSDPVMNELAQSFGPSVTVHRLDLRSTYHRRTRGLGAVLDFDQHNRLRRAIRELAPDVVHVNQQVAEDGLDLLIAAQKSGVPYLSTIHIARSARDLAARFAWLRDQATTITLCSLAPWHITVAESARRCLAARLGRTSAARISVVHNGVSSVDAMDAENARGAVRAEWEVGDDDIVLGCIGRLEEQKNPLFALEICSELRRQGKSARLVWIGDGPLRPRLLERARMLNATSALIVDGWRNDVPRRISGLDFFVLPSHFEGLPLALLEAMHANLPCCVSAADGMPEAIEHGRNGYICKAGDLNSWVACLTAMIEDGELRKDIGTAARASALARFSLKQMAHRTAEVYRAVVEDRLVTMGPVSPALTIQGS